MHGTATERDAEDVLHDYRQGVLTKEDAFAELVMILDKAIRYLSRQAVRYNERIKVMLEAGDYASIAQETLWNCMDKYEPDIHGATFGTYFRRAAQYEMQNEIRRQQAEKRDGNFDNYELDPEKLDNQRKYTPDQDSAMVEFYEALGHIDLNPTQEIVVQGILDGKTQAEIQKEHGWNDGYVTTVLRRLKTKFERAGLNVYHFANVTVMLFVLTMLADAMNWITFIDFINPAA